MAYTDTVDVVAAGEQTAARRIADISGKAIFVSLLCLIVFTAIPYGTAEAWWKAFFICAVFALCILALVEGLLSSARRTSGWALLFPLLLLAAFSFLQTIPFGNRATPSIAQASWTAISVDPFGTQFFAFQILALALAAVLMYRYASSERRMRILIHTIIAVAFASALFGIIRQTSQHAVGFGLPRIQPDQGYGQFINQNHFAFLMEMGFGLALGMLVAGGVRREKAMIYLAALLPIWTALVLSNSRGALLAMLAQLVATVLLFPLAVPATSGPQLKAFAVARSLPVRVLLLLVLLIGVSVGTLWIGGERLATKLEQGEVARNPAAVSRNEIWQATWQMFKAHPIAGVGMGGYWIAVPAHHNASGTMGVQEAHNDYLELLASGGIIGAAIGVWFFIVLWRRTYSTLRSPNRFRRVAGFAASIGIIGVAVHSLFDFGLHMMVNALIFMALVVIATMNANVEDQSENA
ncbi:MAG: O-antigen ligase family protein [Pyrinomonadaceae bacterium]